MLSTRIDQKITFEGDDMVIKNTYDATAALQDVAYARENSANSFGSDYKHVGNIDPSMVTNWLKQAGVSWSDTQGVEDVIKRNLQNGEFAKLRVWDGKW
tara:strand:+ start:208 stop:504 length:297 start_codon:yes stop_codon:yes gene_type:complete